MNKNYPTCVLCDTYEIPEYEDYVEWCKDMEKEPQGEHSDEYWDWVYETQQLEWEDLEMNCKYSDEANVPVVITGHLGLWNGRPEIQPVRCETLFDAIKKCACNVDDVKVELENGHVNVYGYHHDGTNCFEIYKLSKMGQERYYERDYTGYPELKDYHLAKFKGYIY